MVGGIRFRRRFFIWGLWLVSFFFFLSFSFVFWVFPGGRGVGEGRGGEKTTIEEGRGTRGEGGGERRGGGARVYEEEGEEEEEEDEDEEAKLNPVNDNNR